jgi:hypothetical protein
MRGSLGEKIGEGAFTDVPFQNTDWLGIDTGAPLREDLERAPACARDRCGKPLPESRASIVRSTTRRGEWGYSYCVQPPAPTGRCNRADNPMACWQPP